MLDTVELKVVADTPPPRVPPQENAYFLSFLLGVLCLN